MCVWGRESIVSSLAQSENGRQNKVDRPNTFLFLALLDFVGGVPVSRGTDFRRPSVNSGFSEMAAWIWPWICRKLHIRYISRPFVYFIYLFIFQHFHF